jgi:hypothetical protein
LGPASAGLLVAGQRLRANASSGSLGNFYVHIALRQRGTAQRGVVHCAMDGEPVKERR